MAISKKNIDLKIKKHNESVKNKNGTLGNKGIYLPDISTKRSLSNNSSVKVICPSTGKVLEEITSKDKGFFKPDEFNSMYSVKSVSYSDHDYYDDISDSLEDSDLINKLTK